MSTGVDALDGQFAGNRCVVSSTFDRAAQSASGASTVDSWKSIRCVIDGHRRPGSRGDDDDHGRGRALRRRLEPARGNSVRRFIDVREPEMLQGAGGGSVPIEQHCTLARSILESKPLYRPSIAWEP